LEYYNEKLMCFTISKQLSLVDRAFKDSKTFVALKDNLLIWQDHNSHKNTPIYLVLDNVERIIAIERVKKNLEKIFIVADMVAPLISILIIHDTYIDEFDMFSKSLLNEYNFTPFVLNPMDEDSMREVIKAKYFKYDPEDPNKEKFDDYFKFMKSQLDKQTVNIKKFMFITKIMFKIHCNKPFGYSKKILGHIAKNFYSNVTDIKEIEEEIQREKEEKAQKDAEQKVQEAYNGEDKTCVPFLHNKVTFYDEIKGGDTTSYTFVEAMILLSAFLAAHNKESNDEISFSCTRRGKTKKKKGKQTTSDNVITHMDLGKTKKFSMERMLTILQYFIANFCEKSEEAHLCHHSINVYSKINTFVSENLFKRSQGRNEDPSAVSLKINYDRTMVDDVLSKQFQNINLADFLE